MFAVSQREVRDDVHVRVRQEQVRLIRLGTQFNGVNGAPTQRKTLATSKLPAACCPTAYGDETHDGSSLHPTLTMIIRTILAKSYLTLPLRVTYTVPIRNMASIQSDDRYKLVFFVPPQNLSEIKTAIFAAGAGRYPGPGGYTECCFTTPGVGQFRPGDAANPHIGEVGKIEEVGEVKCETLCVGRETTRAAVEALKK